MSNGLHTIVWVVTDSGGFVEGLGSRYFNVSNGEGAPPPSESTRRTDTAVAASPLAAPRADAATIDAVPLDPAPVSGRRGWALDAPLRAYTADASGRVLISGEELDRFELRLGGSASTRYAGYVRVGRALAPLPIGSHLDSQTGVFTWGTGVGFVGTYDLVFVRGADGRVDARQEVRVVLRPKGSGQRGPQVVIDMPGAQQDVGQPFSLGRLGGGSRRRGRNRHRHAARVGVSPERRLARIRGRGVRQRLPAGRRGRVWRAVPVRGIRSDRSGSDARKLRPRGVCLEPGPRRLRSGDGGANHRSLSGNSSPVGRASRRPADFVPRLPATS